MELTDDERKALERYRVRHERKSYPEYVDDLKLLAEIAERDRPIRTYGDLVIRWDDLITPERLVACGFKPDSRSYGHVMCVSYFDEPVYTELVYRPSTGCWFVAATKMGCDSMPWWMTPRNMLELWHLMERCGIKEQSQPTARPTGGT